MRHFRFTFGWISAVVVVSLVAAHLGGIYLLRHKPLASAAGGIALLLFANHLGVLAPVYARFRKRSDK